MKKILALLLALCLVLGLSASALAAGAPKIVQQPTTQTTNKNGSATFTFKVSKNSPFNVNESGWRFLNPATGEVFTSLELRELMADVKGFQLKASDKKRTLSLKNVPETMHGWEVYVVLVNNGYTVTSDHATLWCYGLEQVAPTPRLASPTETEPTPEPQPASPTETEPTAEPAPEPTAEPTAEPTPEPTAEPTAEPAAEPTAEPTPEPTAEPTPEPVPEGPKEITVTAEKLKLVPLDSHGNPLEDQAASTLVFQGSGDVAVRAESPVKYWLVNGIRILPTENVTGFILKNITTDLSISAKFDDTAAPAAALDPNRPCTVTCEGCVFTYHGGGLSSVTAGSVPAGASVIIRADAEADVSGGYSINGGEPVNAGKTSFMMQITEDTVITLP